MQNITRRTSLPLGQLLYEAKRKVIEERSFLVLPILGATKVDDDDDFLTLAIWTSTFF